MRSLASGDNSALFNSLGIVITAIITGLFGLLVARIQRERHVAPAPTSAVDPPEPDPHTALSELTARFNACDRERKSLGRLYGLLREGVRMRDLDPDLLIREARSRAQ